MIIIFHQILKLFIDLIHYIQLLWLLKWISDIKSIWCISIYKKLALSLFLILFLIQIHKLLIQISFKRVNHLISINCVVHSIPLPVIYLYAIIHIYAWVFHNVFREMHFEVHFLQRVFYMLELFWDFFRIWMLWNNAIAYKLWGLEIRKIAWFPTFFNILYFIFRVFELQGWIESWLSTNLIIQFLQKWFFFFDNSCIQTVIKLFALIEFRHKSFIINWCWK